jgi:hypothetical protein
MQLHPSACRIVGKNIGASAMLRRFSKAEGSGFERFLSKHMNLFPSPVTSSAIAARLQKSWCQHRGNRGVGVTRPRARGILRRAQ